MGKLIHAEERFRKKLTIQEIRDIYTKLCNIACPTPINLEEIYVRTLDGQPPFSSPIYKDFQKEPA